MISDLIDTLHFSRGKPSVDARADSGAEARSNKNHENTEILQRDGISEGKGGFELIFPFNEVTKKLAYPVKDQVCLCVV